MPGRTINPQKRKAIITAATKLFLKNDFTNSSMDDIAQGTAIRHGLLPSAAATK